jgi:flagellar hook protein FlgE
VSAIPVFDSAGGSHTFSVKFTNNSAVTPSSWLVAVSDERNSVVKSGEIRFGTDGTPLAGFNSLDLTLPPGANGSAISLFFGDPGSTSGARSLSAAASDLQLARQDGLAAASLTRASFDIDGALALTYSNGQTTKGDRLAIATVTGEQSLEPREGNLFVAPDDGTMTLGTANTGPFGKIQAGRVEISNVDLAQEFSDLIISQRGYQASSQVISAANEMIQQLFEIRQRG